ncbi:hypothetical protein [Granulicoccus sp. GXG6511]|uniref:hypothetical protein n=1 Tax=Granulicoccus sp. GXG6511 TaxID=3381351 RepID=UPI003D7D3ECD
MRSTISPKVDHALGIGTGSVDDDLDPKTTDEPTPEEEEKTPFLGLKPTQVIGGALASCTAAVLGGQLGVAGTVAGAALTSVTIAVGGALYTRTFDRTKDGIDTAVSKFRLAGTPPVTDGAATDATRVLPAQTPGAPVYGNTTYGVGAYGTDLYGNATPHRGDDPTRVVAAQAYSTPAENPERIVAAQAEAKAEADRAMPWYRRFSPVTVLAAAAAFFLIAAVVVTGLESIRGTSVSGGEGTTIGQISRGDVTTQHSRTAPTEPQQDDAVGTDSQPTEPAGEATTEPTTAPTEAGETTQPTTDPTTAPTTEPNGATTAPTTGTGSGADTQGSSGSGQDSSGSGSTSESGTTTESGARSAADPAGAAVGN